MDIVKKSLELHKQWKGKIEVISTVPVNNKQDLSLAYTPGVAEPCLEIQKDPDLSYEYTRRWNLAAVVTDGQPFWGWEILAWRRCRDGRKMRFIQNI